MMSVEQDDNGVEQQFLLDPYSSPVRALCFAVPNPCACILCVCHTPTHLQRQADQMRTVASWIDKHAADRNVRDCDCHASARQEDGMEVV
jgi:hypothetical protein